MTNWHLIFYNISITFYTLSTFIYIYNFVHSTNLFKKFKFEYFFLLMAFLFHFIFIIFRWILVGHAPMNSMFEYLNVFSFFIVLSYLIMFRFFKVNVVGFLANTLILVTMILASNYTKEITPIVPALNSYWLGLHVSLAALGEGLFAISFIASFLYLIKASTNSLFSKLILELLLFLFINIISFTVLLSFFGKPLSFLAFVGPVIYFIYILYTKTLITSIFGKKLRTLNSSLLDQLSYQSIAFGYPIFTLGALVFAMIWADQAWGSYWSWDPKETWALISWLIYGLYLHLRLLKGWGETKTAWVSLVGFIIILFTLFGVTYLIPGNHTYI